MDVHDETRTLRRRLADIEGWQVPAPVSDSSPSMVAQVVDGGTGHFPTSMPNQFMVVPVRITGKVAEGLAGTNAAGPTPFLCVVFGATLPVVGDYLVVRKASGRWVAETGGVNCVSSGIACVVVTGCNNSPLSGATVALIQGGTTIATGTTTGRVTSITLTGAGSGYGATVPAVTISGGGGSGAAAVAVMGAGGTVAAIFITDYGTGYTATPTVSVAPPPSGTTATASATMAARACLPYTSTGTATLQVTGAGAGYPSTTSTVVSLACGTASFTIALSPTTGYTCCPGCNSPVPFTLHGTDSAGVFTLTWDGGTGGPGGTGHWVGSINHTHSGITSFTGTTCNAGPVTAPVSYSLRCSTGQWLLTQQFHTACRCCATTTCLAGCDTDGFCLPSIVVPAPCAASTGNPGPGIQGVVDLPATGSPACITMLSFDFSASIPCHVIEAGTVAVTL